MLPTIVTVNPFMAKRKRRRKTHNPHRAARRAHYRARGKMHNRFRKRRRRAVHNPFSFSRQGLGRDLTGALIGAGGAIATDVAMAYLPLPAVLQSGWANLLTRAAVAVGVGYVAGHVMGRETGKAVAAGGLIVVAYGGLKQALAPTLGASIKGLSGLADFGDYTPITAGGYGSEPALMMGNTGFGAYMRPAGGMGAYMRPRTQLGAYMNPGSILRQKQMAGYGGLGAYDFQGSEGSMM